MHKMSLNASAFSSWLLAIFNKYLSNVFFRISQLLPIPRLLLGEVVYEEEKTPVLSKHCSSTVCYQHCSSHKSKIQHLQAAMKKNNSSQLDSVHLFRIIVLRLFFVFSFSGYYVTVTDILGLSPLLSITSNIGFLGLRGFFFIFKGDAWTSMTS